jgi:hypothetical protein
MSWNIFSKTISFFNTASSIAASTTVRCFDALIRGDKAGDPPTYITVHANDQNHCNYVNALNITQTEVEKVKYMLVQNATFLFSICDKTIQVLKDTQSIMYDRSIRSLHDFNDTASAQCPAPSSDSNSLATIIGLSVGGGIIVLTLSVMGIRYLVNWCKAEKNENEIKLIPEQKSEQWGLSKLFNCRCCKGEKNENKAMLKPYTTEDVKLDVVSKRI